MDIPTLQTEAYNTAVSKGWWEEKRTPLELLMLVVTELTEAAECHRNNEPMLSFEADGKPVGFASELADVVIRVADIAGGYGIDLNDVIEKKLAYNKTRPYKHGGKLL